MPFRILYFPFYSIDFLSEKAAIIQDADAVNTIFSEIKKASESSDWYENSSPESSGAKEFHIGLKFNDVIAIYDAGYLAKTESGRWGLYLYDLQPYELYLLDDNTLSTLTAQLS